MLQIPSSITKALKKSPFDNNYFCMHENMQKSLKKVVAGVDTYSSFHYSMLINDLEICLKGFLLYKKESGEWNEPHPHYLTEDHKIMKLIEQVQKFAPLFDYSTQSDWNELRKFVSGLCRQYTTARYSVEVPFEDFVHLYNDFAMPIINKVYDSLQEKENNLDEFYFGL